MGGVCADRAMLHVHVFFLKNISGKQHNLELD